MSEGHGGSNGRARGRNQIPLIEEVGNYIARRDHDFYETPAWMTRAMLRRIPISGRVLECCAGKGAMSREIVGPGRVVVVNEPFQGHDWSLADTTYSKVFRLDATLPTAWMQFPAVDWVVTNPPFNLSHLIVPLALEHAKFGVAMVLRLSWFEPTDDREAFLDAHPPDAIITMPRHKFRKVGSGDSVTTGWFVWLANEGVKRFGHFRNDTVTRAERDALKVAA